MNTKLVSSIGDVAHSRLLIVGVDTWLMDAAKLLTDTHIGLVVVCSSDGAMAGVITKTDIVRLIGGCCGNACRIRVADVMTQEVTSCHPTDCLPDVLSMMQQRGVVHIPVVDENYGLLLTSRSQGLNGRSTWKAVIVGSSIPAAGLGRYGEICIAALGLNRWRGRG